MPEAIAEVEQMGPMIPRQGLPLLAEIGDVVQPCGAQAIVFLLGDVAAAGILALAEIERKGHLLVVGDVLAVEYQNGIFVHAGFDLGRFRPGQRLAQIEARNLADKMLVKLPDRDRHHLAPEPFSPETKQRSSARFSRKATLRERDVNAPSAWLTHAFRAISPPSTGMIAPVTKD